MRKSYTTFPGGKSGIGLLFLRIVAGVATAAYGVILLISLETIKQTQFPYVVCLILSLVLISGSVFLMLGLMMPFITVLIALCMVIEVYLRFIQVSPLEVSDFNLIGLLMLLSILIALVFLGPGAFSVDARLFGRRRIFIPASKKEDEQQ